MEGSDLPCSDADELKPSHAIENRDRISGLPDTILHHILSFTDTKYAVQTSILSKRWKHVWTSLPYLNFDQNLFWEPKPVRGEEDRRTNRFMDFVDRVLLFRDGSNVLKFQLSCGSCMNIGRVVTWTHILVRCNIQELDFDISADESVQLPDCLFTCKSLRVLKLSLGSRHPVLVIPNSTVVLRFKVIHIRSLLHPMSLLPRLKVLHLRSLSLMDGDLIDDLSSKCPALESLIITNCKVKRLGNLNITSLLLKNLVIEICHEKLYIDEDEFEDFDRPDKCKIKISAPNLLSFKCSDYITREYYLGNLSEIINADIDFYLDHNSYIDIGSLSLRRKKKHANCLIKWLKGLYNAKYLIFSFWSLKIISEVFDLLEEALPAPFPNLNYLKLKARPCCGMIYLLNGSPSIETLVLEIIEEKLDLSVNYWESQFQFLGTLNHLKYVVIWNFSGHVHEVVLLKFLLTNAVVLEELVIHPSEGWKHDSDTGERLLKVGDEIKKFSRASASSIRILSFLGCSL
uniref:F-box domain-containing protein n=1 Tax=Nelumbo nucifera TaxID=4432 RepID=A0A822XPZ1_NELNU|nr:TPA_asm: hypothetical protein HUJ06_022258 [Nelumbo nucifera]